jgi:hypothetical protein
LPAHDQAEAQAFHDLRVAIEAMSVMDGFNIQYRVPDSGTAVNATSSRASPLHTANSRIGKLIDGEH